MVEFSPALPDTAHVGDPGHTDDHNAIVAGLHALNDGKAEVASVGVNVLDYGAIGDGSTDDLEAIEAAITAAGVGGTVVFPTGVYSVSETLYPLNQQTWVGEHNPRYWIDDASTKSSCHIKMASTFTGTCLIGGNSSVYAVNLRHLGLVGRGDEHATASDGIDLGSRDECGWLIDTCTIWGFSGAGVTGRMHVFDIRDSHIARCGWGILADDYAMNDVRISGCQVYYCLHGGIGMTSTTPSAAVTITGCRIERSGNEPEDPDNPRDTTASGIYITAGNKIDIVQVSTDANTGPGLDIQGSGVELTVYAVAVVACNFMRDGGGDQSSETLPGVRVVNAQQVKMVACLVTFGPHDDEGEGEASPHYGLWLEDSWFCVTSACWFSPATEDPDDAIHLVGDNYGSEVSATPALAVDETGLLTIAAPTGVAATVKVVSDSDSAYVNLDGQEETERFVKVFTDGVLRWTVGANTEEETGSDAGSNFIVSAYDDSGDWLFAPLAINRDDGSMVVKSVWIDGGSISNFTTAVPATVPEVTGSRGGNAALASLLTALDTLGLITDSST